MTVLGFYQLAPTNEGGTAQFRVPKAPIGFPKFIHEQNFDIVIDGRLEGIRGSEGLRGDENAIHLTEGDFESLLLNLD